jgi:hypothetical protein
LGLGAVRPELFRPTEIDFEKVEMANSLKYKIRKLFTEPAPWEVDIEAFLAARRPDRSGFGRDMAKLQADRRRARRLAVMAARAEATRKRWEASPGGAARKRDGLGRWARQGLLAVSGARSMQVLAAMHAGLWYADPDLRRLTGLPNRIIQPILRQRLERRGMVEQGLNPEWRPELRGKGVPKKLWRLTAKGESAAKMARMLG